MQPKHLHHIIHLRYCRAVFEVISFIISVNNSNNHVYPATDLEIAMCEKKNGAPSHHNVTNTKYGRLTVTSASFCDTKDLKTCHIHVIRTRWSYFVKAPGFLIGLRLIKSNNL